MLRVIDVTPEMARQWLAATTGQRKPDKRHVGRLALDMRRGTFEVTLGQPIWLNRKGGVVNGQHRLLALLEHGRPVRMAVLFDDDAGDAMGRCIDVSIKGRRFDLQLGIPLFESRLASGAWRLTHGNAGAPIGDIRDLSLALSPVVRDMSRTCRAMVTQVSVQIGAVLNMYRAGPKERREVAEQYNAMAVQDYAVMVPSVAALNKRILRDKRASKEDIAALSHRAFGDLSRNVTRCFVKNDAAARDDVRRATQAMVDALLKEATCSA